MMTVTIQSGYVNANGLSRRVKIKHNVKKLKRSLKTMSVVLQLEIKAFEAKLDKYDTATVNALMENQKQLDTVNANIEAMLAQAYVMEDGRRVFKTEDGSQVFDEFGQEVSSGELDFDLISDKQPTWETYQKDTATRDEILAGKEDIHVYQEKLDEAREQVSEGDISAAELEALDEELLEMMPDAVSDHVPGMEKTATTPDLTDPSSTAAILPTTAVPSSSSSPAPSTLQFLTTCTGIIQFPMPQTGLSAYQYSQV